MRVVSVRGVVPEHRHAQSEITEAFVSSMLAGVVDRALVERFHGNAGVRTRHLALPLEEYSKVRDFGAANDIFIRVGTQLGAQAVTDALKAAGLTPQDVDVIVSATVTGFAVPTLDARIASLLGFREDVVRMPLVGLGCVAGAAGVARMHDYLLGHPDQVAVFVAVELCSLTLQHDDTSAANLVASGLFGDGAAAVVAVGNDRDPLATAGSAGPQPEVLATRSRLYPDSERTMGWDVRASGLRIVLNSNVPEVVRRYVGEDVRAFLADHGLHRDDVRWYVAHPGGPKVLEALADALEVPRAALGVTWDSLARVGNLSSASVLHVLADTLADHPPPPGSYGLMLAMGPGFCSELVLLRAPETSAPCSSQAWFTLLVVAVALERGAELVVSRRNSSWSLAQGGVETGQGHYPVMVALHTAFLVGVLLEVWLRRPEFLPGLAWPILALVLAAQALRWWCIDALGQHWNTRVIVVPGVAAVRRGPYRFLAHPNYLAVVVEGVALPLVHTAWVTALLFTVANAALLRTRLQVEDAALAGLPGRSGAVS